MIANMVIIWPFFLPLASARMPVRSLGVSRVK